MVNDTLFQQLTGQSFDHVCFDTLPAGVAKPVHQEMLGDFLLLQAQAKEAGFDLQIASGFRDFSRQLHIWQEKVAGIRAVYDDNGQAINVSGLTQEQLLFRILRWSAIPGTSRHHWGTDIDIFDAAAVADDYVVQLSAEETADGGVFGPMHCWLDGKLNGPDHGGWFRPYGEDRGALGAERWHLSFGPLALKYQRALDAQSLLSLLESLELPLIGVIKGHWDEIYRCYINVPWGCYPSR